MAPTTTSSTLFNTLHFLWQVFRATKVADGPHKSYAIKMLDKDHIKRHNKIKYVKSERDILTKLRSEFIIRLYSTFQTKASLFYVMEYCAGGELQHQLSKQGALPLHAARFWLAELTVALEHLAAHNIVHRDLKPENVLLSAEGHVKLCDFGTAKVLAPATAASSELTLTSSGAAVDLSSASFVGTADFVSPEVIEGVDASLSSDLWGLGCITYQCFAGRPPFYTATETQAAREYQTMEKVRKAEYSFPPEDERRADADEEAWHVEEAEVRPVVHNISASRSARALHS